MQDYKPMIINGANNKTKIQKKAKRTWRLLRAQ